MTENSNPELFDAVAINQKQGRLILEHASGKAGFADLTVVATDSGGLSVGMSTSEDFVVYNKIFGRNGTSPDTSELGLKPLDLWTGWRFFDLVDGSYATDKLSTEKFTRFLTDPEYTDPTHAHVFNIETPDHVNTPEGRDNFAELLGFAKEVNPDLEIGVYRIMPKRAWHAPVIMQRGLDEAELGLSTFATSAVSYYEGVIQDWHAGNALYRTEPVSEEFGRGTVAELVDTVNPSLYTHDRDFVEHWRLAQLDADFDTLTVDGDGPSFEDVETVKLEMATDASLDNGLALETEYYVVNAEGFTFQLSTTPDGPPIDFDDEFSGRIYAAATGDLKFTFHDSNVRYWYAYAEANIAEARKFDKPVNAWISPSVAGLGVEQFSYDFFRSQLEVLRPIADAVTVYQWPTFEGSFYVEQAWWQALDDFTDTLDQPANEFRVSVGNIEDANESPVARIDMLTAKEDTAIVWQVTELLDNDVDTEKLDLASFTQPQHGKLIQRRNGSLFYQPDEDYHGRDEFRYRATDGNSLSNSAIVTIDVRPVNDRPTAEGETLTTGDSEPLYLGPNRVLNNDFDIDGDTLEIHVFEGPKHGVLKQNANGVLIYTPDSQFVGQDEIQYQAFDGVAKSSAATIVVDVIAKNDPPTATDDRLRTEEDQPISFPSQRLLKNDRDPEGDQLAIRVIQGPAHGTIEQQDDGKWLYTPNANFSGEDEFFYRAFDGEVRSNLARVAIDVTPVNDDPVARADKMVAREDTPLVFRDQRLLRNDVDVDDDALRVIIVDSPQHGTLKQNRSGVFVYTPRPNYHGLDQFGYRVNDGNGRSDVVAVQIRVASSNDRPVAVPDLYVTRFESNLRVEADGVLGNDRDVDGDQLLARLHEGPRHGKLTLNADGSFVYRPNAGFQGNDGFRYVSSDGQGGGTVGSVQIHVAATASGTASNSSADDAAEGGGSGLNARIEALMKHVAVPESIPRPRR